MKKHELLVPAGDMECLRQAVANGCDAVYLACKLFGARKFAKNFDNDEIIEAIKYCHLYGVKIYVTMNTLVKNNEVDDFLKQAKFLHENGVDALIVQDFGMICLLREKFPNLEIHASTQANISSGDVCKLYYDLGVKRVVFARELSIDEIDSIDVDIEKEAFIHGALCISYSGCCLMSSMLGGRSGNRGECAGCCRMPFNLEKNGKIISHDKYLLSTKELNTSSEIERLLDSSIYSFKIEGRMKSPLYVGFITNFYRRLIDGEKIDLVEETDKLKTIFNREFTIGRMFNTSDSDLMNVSSPNHKGLKIGKVVTVTDNKIKIKLDDGYSIHQNDAIRFLNSNKGFIINYLYDKNDKLISSSDNEFYVDNKVGLKETDDVSKTQDYLLEKEYSVLKERKVDVTFNVKAMLGNNLEIEISDGENTIKEIGNVIEESINSPISKDNIINQLSKLGNTPFKCINCSIDMDNNIFISLKVLNEIRRSLVEKLINKRQNIKVDFIEKEVFFDKNNYSNDIGKSCFVYNGNQLNKCRELGINRIYTGNKELLNKDIYYAYPRCSYSYDTDYSKLLVSDYRDYSNYNVIGNYTLNIFNIYTAYYLNRIGIKNMCLSVELSEDELLEFIDLYNNKFGKTTFEVLVYGRVENMIIKGNILGIDENDYTYNLIDFKNRKFPVYYDGVNTHILNHENRNIDVNKFINKCILRYDFYNEESDSIYNIVKM